MDEAQIREHAEGHGQAVVAGDLRRAGADLTKEVMEQAGEVMKSIPAPAKSAEVTEVRQEGDDFVAAILYTGDDKSTTVESRWADRDGRPMITNLTVV